MTKEEIVKIILTYPYFKQDCWGNILFDAPYCDDSFMNFGFAKVLEISERYYLAAHFSYWKHIEFKYTDIDGKPIFCTTTLVKDSYDVTEDYIRSICENLIKEYKKCIEDYKKSRIEKDFV